MSNCIKALAINSIQDIIIRVKTGVRLRVVPLSRTACSLDRCLSYKHNFSCISASHKTVILIRDNSLIVL